MTEITRLPRTFQMPGPFQNINGIPNTLIMYAARVCLLVEHRHDDFEEFTIVILEVCQVFDLEN